MLQPATASSDSELPKLRSSFKLPERIQKILNGQAKYCLAYHQLMDDDTKLLVGKCIQIDRSC